ncbi:phosphorylase [Glycomyces sp. NPDC021274]|uniref:5'-methylthioadenosine/S-adenosylhomocysteine nucleosidase family protein n=1 Tax=Glycomyces sp. NPDC021274 TaxID=3155120 RepID=UPI0033D676FD
MTDLPTAVLCTPIDLERRAVLDLLAGHEFTDRELDGHQYRETEYEGPKGIWRLVLAMTGRGNERAAASVEHALAAWRPQILVLCGIAGGLRDARIGDVVAATKVYGYEVGEDTDAGTLPRPESLSTSFPLHQRAQLLAEDAAWAGPLDARPRVFHRPIASGSKVVTGNASAAAEHLRRHSGDAQAVDTESYGAMAAADRRRTVDATVVRGISDLLGDKTKEADKLRQPLAARNAAAFALALIAHSKPKHADIRRLAGGVSNTYIGAVGNGANANVAAMGDNAHGRIDIEYRT